MSELSYLNLKPLRWSQSIELHPRQDATRSDEYTRIIATCMPTAECALLLRTGARLRNFQISINVLEGKLPDEERRRSKFEIDAIGGLWFADRQVHDSVQGWLYLKERIYRSLWDQVSHRADCQISLWISPLYDDIWRDNPLSILSVSLTFDRRPLADQKAQQESWLSRLFNRLQSTVRP